MNPGTASIVIDCISATDPANVTTPDTGADTAEPGIDAKSTPQWPPYWPTGANGATTDPSTGGTMQTAANNKKLNNSTNPLPPTVPVGAFDE